MTSGRPGWQAAVMAPQSVHTPCWNIPTNEEKDAPKVYSNSNRAQVPPCWGFDLTECAHMELLSIFSE